MKREKAKLIFTFEESDLSKAPTEALERLEADEYEPTGAISVEIAFKCGDLTVDDLFPEDPQKFLENDVLAAFAEQIILGLQNDRGTSFLYASEDAMRKRRDAERAVAGPSLEALMLSMAQPAGEC